MEDKAGRIGLVLFLATEVMFFAGLVAAYWVLRSTVNPWPPVGQPRLPVAVTAANTAVLLLSGIAILQTRRALAKGCRLCVVGWLGLTGLGGLTFLLVQGYEWMRLIHFGLTTVQNIYGGTFYFIVGAHAVHLIVALAVLFVVFLHAAEGRYSPTRNEGLALCRIYWLFVTLLWPVLYGIIYLA